jgi:uncharacterized lipoprotein NlpE involved in copper resistance
MKQIVSIVFIVLLLSGCNEKSDEQKYQWGVAFCGKKEDISSLELYGSIASVVRCKDGRRADIPDS